MDLAKAIAGILLVGLLLTGPCWYRCAQWNECRDTGLSRFYCWKHTF